MQAIDAATLDPAIGLAGDHYAGRNGLRQVSLIAEENLASIASFLGRAAVPPSLLRRNFVTFGVNLLALKGRRFRLGPALLECTGECHPCSRMEQLLGPGGYNAVRGQGGVLARVLDPGVVRVGDTLVRGELC